MNVTIHPSVANGTVAAPPSKSMAHRLLIAAGLANGTSVLSDFTFSEDLYATADCLSMLGAKILIDRSTVTVRGIGGDFSNFQCNQALDCRASGSTLRFLIPLCWASGKRSVLRGTSRLMERPLSVYRDIAKEQNLGFSVQGQTLTLCGRLSAGNYTVPGNVSSQFVSGLLFALPLLNGDSTLTVTPPVESRPYIDMTAAVLRQSGIELSRNADTFFIRGNASYRPIQATVEGDASNAAVLSAFGLFGGNVTVTGLSDTSLQGDRVFPVLLEQLQNGSPTIDLSDCPDLAPLLFTVASLFHGATFTGTRRLCDKESNRAAAMQEELAKCGADLSVEENRVTVHKTALHPPKVPLCSHNDHRVVMALSVLLSALGGTITGAEAVQKSYPAFFRDIQTLGINVTK